MKLSIHTYLKLGRYRVLQVLGNGGFGITYKVIDTATDKEYAIKELYPNIFCTRNSGSNEVFCTTEANKEHFKKLKQRFLREVKNLQQLHHRGIIEVYDVFEENNTIYYVMEFIEGRTLDELVRENGFLSVEKAKYYIELICDALGYIHSKNMTHLDVKPANIMIRRSDNMPILIDFGLSKQYDASGGATSTLLGAASQGFSPIEQYGASDDLMTFSPASDIYSLSATLLFMLTGIIPPPASQLAYSPLDLSTYSFPEYVKRTIRKGMSLDKAQRFPDVTSFLDSLKNRVQSPQTNGNASSADSTATTIVIGTAKGGGSKPVEPDPPANKSIFKNVFVGIAIGIVVLFILLKSIGKSTPASEEIVEPDSDTLNSVVVGDVIGDVVDSDSNGPYIAIASEEIENTQELSISKSFNEVILGNGSIKIPSFMTYVGRDENGSAVYKDKNDEIGIWTERFVDNSIDGMYDYVLGDVDCSGPVQNKKSSDQFILSGYTCDNNIYYSKGYLDKANSIVYFALMIYPQSKRHEMDDYVGKIFNSFPNLR